MAYDERNPGTERDRTRWESERTRPEDRTRIDDRTGMETGRGMHGTRSTRVITAAFNDWDSAESAYRSIVDRSGYSDDDVSVIMSEDTRKEFLKAHEGTRREMGNKAPEGAGIGGGIGATLGGVAGAIAAAAAPVAFPGIGIVLSGPLAAAAAGAGVGGVGGGLIGGLIGLGIPEEHAKNYETHLKEGGVVLAVEPRTEEDARFFEDTFAKYGDKHMRR
jgi:hypothetical protein